MSLIRGFISVSLLTLLSRVFGYIRDLTIAFFLGAGIYTDAFVIAFRLPNLFRTIFGEGALNSVFVPLFARITDAKGAQEASKFATGILIVLLIALTIFTAIAYLVMPQLVVLLTPGFKENPEILRLTIVLSYIMFPYLALASLIAFFGGILNANKCFWPFASAPIILNLIAIAALLSSSGSTELETVIGLSTSIVIAGVVEVLWCAYLAYKIGFRINRKISLQPEIKTFFKNIGPAILGSSVAQINIFLTSILASFTTSGISYLYYADRIYQLPLALIGTALGTVLVPYVAKSKTRREGIKHINKSIELTLFIILPISIIFCLYAYEIVKLLFERGEFKAEDTVNTARALAIYSIALPGYALTKILFSSFYANNDTRTPFVASLISLAANFILGFALLDKLGFISVCYGAILGAYLNIALLSIKGIKKGYFNYAPIRKLVMRILVASGTVALVAIILKHFSLSSGYLVVDLGGSILVLSCIYLMVLKRELSQFTKIR